jgi:hypothetical protein
MRSIDDGMQIDRSDEQFANADSPTVKFLPPDSNSRVATLQQDAKHFLAICLTDAGMQID